MGKSVLQFTKFRVFLRYSLFFPDLCASENASLIAGNAVPFVSMRCLPPNKKTNTERKLNKTLV